MNTRKRRTETHPEDYHYKYREHIVGVLEKLYRRLDYAELSENTVHITPERLR